MSLTSGSCVTHAKLPDLGVGEVVSFDGDKISIRFASGPRMFMYALVAPHLAITSEPAPPAPKSSKRTSKAPPKTASKA